MRRNLLLLRAVKQKRKWILPGLLLVLAGMQLFNPARTNPPVQNDFLAATRPPPALAAKLRAACYDCHSYETVWPLYARIAPAAWLVAADVNEGREHLNFSEWPTEPERAAKKLDRVNEVLDYREMPPKKYTLIHGAARLTESERKEIMDWTETAAQKLRNTNQP